MVTSVEAKVASGRSVRGSSLLSRLKYLARLLARPEFYDKISEPLANAGSLDTTLATVCYGSLLLSELIRYRPQITKYLRGLLGKLINLLSRLLSPIIQLPKGHIDAITDKPSSTKPIESVAPSVSNRLKSISSYISDVRVFNRMWALPETISFGISGLGSVYHDQEISVLAKCLEAIDIVSIVLYQPLENLAFANEHGWTKNDTKTANRLSTRYYNVSSALWGIYLAAEIVKLSKQVGKVGFSNKDLNERLLTNLLNLPLSYHWSYPEGKLNSLTVGLLGFLASLRGSKKVWGQVVSGLTSE